MAQSIALAEATMWTEHPTAFDAWLQGELTRAFGTADGEALPEELLALLPQDEDARAG